MTRDEVVEEAKSWVGTPYMERARIKGIGVDCQTLIFEVYRKAGFIPDAEIAEFERTVFSPDWFAHHGKERYMLWAERHARKTIETFARGTVETEPGNFLLARVVRSKRMNHGAIILKWPMVVHACGDLVSITDVTTHPMLSFQEIAVFDPWSLHADW